MKLFLSGYGKMGHMIEALALEKGWQVIGHADIDCVENYETAPKADVCIDFSGVGALPHLLAYVRRTGTPLVSGTTGLAEPDFDALNETAKTVPVIWTANYSTGVAVLRRMLREYAQVLADWDKEIVEKHHNQKVDAPSGTAKLLLEALDPDGRALVVHGRGSVRQAEEGRDRRLFAARRHRRGRAHGQLLRRGRGFGDHAPGCEPEDLRRRRPARCRGARGKARGPVFTRGIAVLTKTL